MQSSDWGGRWNSDTVSQNALDATEAVNKQPETLHDDDNRWKDDEVGSQRRFVGSRSASLILDLARGGRKRSIRVLACARSLRDCGYRQWQQAPREAWLGTARIRPSPFNADPPTGPERNGTTLRREYTATCVTGRRHCYVDGGEGEIDPRRRKKN